MSTTYDTLNNVLVRLFHDIMTLEEKAIRTGEFSEISNNDMHIIEAIGIDEPRNMSFVAKKLSVTVGTLTIAVNNLVKKVKPTEATIEEIKTVSSAYAAPDIMSGFKQMIYNEMEVQ